MANTYPLPKFHFVVRWGGTRIGFSEVTGLDMQVEAIEYREGSNPQYSKIKMPGMHKFSNITGGYYPPVGFHFKVEFVGIGNDNDVRFQSVSGLSVEFDTEAYEEGGENRFEHTLPVRTKYPDLSLKRGSAKWR